MALRGEIYYAKLGDSTTLVGSEMQGTRPVLVVSADEHNVYAPTVIVVPLTSQEKTNALKYVYIPKAITKMDRDSYACVIQIRTIDKHRLQEKCKAIVPIEYMEQVERSIIGCLGFKGWQYMQEQVHITEQMRKEQTEVHVAMTTNEMVENVEYTTPETTESAAVAAGMYDWVNVAKKQQRFYAQLETYLARITEEYVNTQNEVTEILQYITHTAYGVVNGYKIYRLLREKQQKIQKLQLEIEQVRILTERIDCKQLKQAYQSVYDKMRKIETTPTDSSTVEQMIASVI